MVKEQIKMRVLPHLDNMEILQATYVTQSFSRHTHDGFAMGVIERGALKFYYRGENIVAPHGQINLAIPGEAHNGHAASNEGWTYRMFYLEPAMLRQAASEIKGKPGDIPFFRAGVLRDDAMAAVLRRLHILLEKPETPVIEQESLLLWTLSQFIMRHADGFYQLRPAGREQQAVRKVREYIEDNFNEDISIKQLSAMANLSPFHLIRVFRKEVGIPPHAYLKQARIKKAKALIASGLPIARVSMETGFTDQSHLTRHFKGITGITPGQYSNFIQDLH
ncbi:transcriptional regulator [Desulfocucumis palustris]|uniref:Transcriptional regulator n=1 Tax=Desulfocucumis palustris TaxID=1898651 RepID=A0A2L2XE18_9FIRM|nr:AraC family transcriptional regulator [Desulfocucumis palustris]GBF34609.1 transcriptional regulator [Desulfocucumis palustris]